MNDLLICKFEKCQKYLLDPILLPCSNNICKSHVDDLEEKEEMKILKCLVCNEDHEIPKNGFILNTSIAKLFDLNWHLPENRKKIAELVRKLKEDVKSYESLVLDPDNLIFENITSVRNNIDLKRERLIKMINDLSDQMLEELKEYEDECKENLLKLTDLNEKHKAYLSDISKDLSNLNEELRIPQIENERIDVLLDQSNQLLNDINRKYYNFQNILTMNQSWCFDESPLKIYQVFGRLRINSFENNDCLFNKTNFRPSMLTPAESADLIKLCEFHHRSQFYLLYKATRDGFLVESFHEKCDKKPNTLTIIKVKGKSNVFGGFCCVSWDKTSRGKYDPKAFIFSLINKDKRPLKIKVANPSKAIFCSEKIGPAFANDIVISNNSNINLESFSNLGYRYESEFYPKGTIEANSYLAGSDKFSTEEIEVYQVI